MLKDLNEISQTLDRVNRMIRRRLAAIEQENKKVNDEQDRIEKLMQGVEVMERRLEQAKKRLDALETVWPGATDETGETSADNAPERARERTSENEQKKA